MSILKPLIQCYSVIRKNLNPVKFPDFENKTWEKVRNLSPFQFCSWVNSFSYFPDRFHGFLDKTESFEHFIDLKSRSGRDCDDFARTWVLYGKANGYNTKEAIVSRTFFPFKFHVVAILEKGGKYTLCDYKNYGPFTSIDECIENINERWQSYEKGKTVLVHWNV
jgi:hypothetical protein